MHNREVMGDGGRWREITYLLGGGVGARALRCDRLLDVTVAARGELELVLGHCRHARDGRQMHANIGGGEMAGDRMPAVSSTSLMHETVVSCVSASSASYLGDAREIHREWDACTRRPCRACRRAARRTQSGRPAASA